MRADYRRWLEQQGYAANTIDAQMHRAGRVEQCHGDLDAHYGRDRLASLIDALRYTSDDESRGLANPSKIPFKGKIRGNLAAYRGAIRRYERYRSRSNHNGETRPFTVKRPVASRYLWMDGHGSLRNLLEKSEYGSMLQAIASLTIFSHPETVAKIGHGNVFAVVRRKNQADVGTVVQGPDGTYLLHDDNTTPTKLFQWVNQLSSHKARDVQYNHVYDKGPPTSRGDGQLEVYTSLANLCVTPAFLAKLTDTDTEVKSTLRRRVFDLYGYAPHGEPAAPPGYDSLRWRDLLPAVRDPEAVLRARLLTGKKGRPTLSVRRCGWSFNGFVPDDAF
jgi:hypothetical protein